MAEFKGTREAFAAALYEMAAENDKVVGVFPDSLKAMRAVPFGETYPDRYIECGIAEQCAVDVAAGLASAGMLPFVGTYCGFLTMRAGEQMRTFVGYTDLNVKFIGVNAGILGGEREGVTHQFYEPSIRPPVSHTGKNGIPDQNKSSLHFHRSVPRPDPLPDSGTRHLPRHSTEEIPYK